MRTKREKNCEAYFYFHITLSFEYTNVETTWKKIYQLAEIINTLH